MAELYRSMQSQSTGRFEEQKTAERRWLGNRGRCQQAQDQRTCLVNLYQQRIDELKKNEGIAQDTTTSVALTNSVVWNHSDRIYRKCKIRDFDCVLKLMKRSGASQEATDFLQREDAWVIEFAEYGNTDLLRLETFRANTNQFYALASPIAGVVHAEGYDFSEKEKQRPELKAVLSQHPEAFFIARPVFVRHEEGLNGGSLIIFCDYLAECRACEPLATGELVYEFNSAGRFIRVELGELKPLH